MKRPNPNARPTLHAPVTIGIAGTEFLLRRVSRPRVVAQLLRAAAADERRPLSDHIERIAACLDVGNNGDGGEPWDSDALGRPRWALTALEWHLVEFVIDHPRRVSKREPGDAIPKRDPASAFDRLGESLSETTDCRVPVEWSCPACGANEMDDLVWEADESERVRCANCGNVYDPNAPDVDERPADPIPMDQDGDGFAPKDVTP